MEEADAKKVPIYLEATPQGGATYANWDFETKAVFGLDVRKYGIDQEPYLNYLMWREPR